MRAAEHGREVLRALKFRVVNIIEKSCVMKDRPTVACIEWMEPLMAAGNWMPELVERAGGVSLFGEAGKHARVAVGVPSLPLDAAVEVDALFAID